MCIIIAIPAGNESTTKTELRTAWENNPDGGGFAYLDADHNLRVEHAMTYKAFADRFWPAFRANIGHSSFLVHMRIATHGETCLGNCHPFDLDGMAIAHNGIIPIPMAKGDKRSDTKVFVDEILAGLPDGWQYNIATLRLIEDYIGASKIALLDPTGELILINEELGDWLQDGRWVSNRSLHMPKRRSLYDWDDDWTWQRYLAESSADAGDGAATKTAPPFGSDAEAWADYYGDDWQPRRCTICDGTVRTLDDWSDDYETCRDCATWMIDDGHRLPVVIRETRPMAEYASLVESS